jgi:hypothetical protein
VDLTPERILDRRLKKKGNVPVIQLKVQWATRPPDEATWEDADVLRLRYPAAVIWNDVASQEEANVTTVSAT